MARGTTVRETSASRHHRGSPAAPQIWRLYCTEGFMGAMIWPHLCGNDEVSQMAYVKKNSKSCLFYNFMWKTHFLHGRNIIFWRMCWVTEPKIAIYFIWILFLCKTIVLKFSSLKPVWMYTRRNLFLNLVRLNRIWVVITHFWLIWHCIPFGFKLMRNVGLQFFAESF